MISVINTGISTAIKKVTNLLASAMFVLAPYYYRQIAMPINLKPKAFLSFPTVMAEQSPQS
jgi:hypothetical protein